MSRSKKNPTSCQQLTRRTSLQLGLGGFFGGGLVNALHGQARAASANGPKPQAKSCILFWLDGGPTHYETFDPKPEAPLEYRGEFEAISTKLPGVQYSQYVPRLAAMADKLAIIRSIRHNQGNHGAGNHYMMTGAPTRIPVGCGASVSFHPSIGSVTAHEVGAPEGLPAYFSMPTKSRSGGPNFLGPKYAPFIVSNDPNSSSFRVRDVALPSGLEDSRFSSRQDLRREVDRLKRINDKAAGDPAVALDQFYQQGNQLITSSEAQAAFDIHREADSVRDSYGRNALGQRALLARRLVEAGVPFITLYSGGWDHHVDLFPRIKSMLPPVDVAVSALINDLDQRGMLDTTMVIVLGEFGRTPKINAKGGRDHWSNAMSVLFAGGGTPPGQIIGATDRKGFSAVERVLSPENFVSTIYTKLGINPDKVLYTSQGRPSHLVSDPTPIAELLS